MKKQTITPDMIKEATISLVALDGLENLTTKKVALSMNISEGTIFNNFSSKKVLLAECLYYIDSQLDHALHSVIIHGLNLPRMIRDLWFAYFNYLASHGAHAKFYRQYRQSNYYNADIVLGQEQSFSFFANFLRKNASLFQFSTDFYWVFIIETTLNFAVRVADGDLPGEPRDIERIYGLISHGMIGNLKPGRKK